MYNYLHPSSNFINQHFTAVGPLGVLAPNATVKNNFPSYSWSNDNDIITTIDRYNSDKQHTTDKWVYIIHVVI